MPENNPYQAPGADLEPVVTSTQSVPAGFWYRFAAFVLDFLVLAPVTGVMFYLGQNIRLWPLYALVPSLLLTLWFKVYLVQRYGGTPGKLLLKMKITMEDGAPVKSGTAFLRNAVELFLNFMMMLASIIAVLKMNDADFASYTFLERSRMMQELGPSWVNAMPTIMGIWFLLSLVVLLFNSKRRAIHDMIARTVVVRVLAPKALKGAS